MFKFTALTADGKTLVGLGLSDHNLEKLQGGMPIVVDLGAEMLPGSDILVVVVWGHTNADIRDEVTRVWGSAQKTTLHFRDDPNPSNPFDEP